MVKNPDWQEADQLAILIMKGGGATEFKSNFRKFKEGSKEKVLKHHRTVDCPQKGSPG